MAAPLPSAAWISTAELCQALTISRSTIGRRRRRGLCKQGHHWIKKNPAMPRSDHLWHLERCAQSSLGRTKPLEEQKYPA